MPVIVSCRCGKRFAAKDHLLGQHVPCPACGQSLVIAATPAASQGVYVACTCGRAFLAPESMRGQQAQCRGCGRMLQVPAYAAEFDPLGIGPVDPLPTMLPSAHRESEIPWDTLKVIAGCGAGLLAIVMIVTSILHYMRTEGAVAPAAAPVASAPAIKPQPTPAPSSSSSASLPPATPVPEATTSPSSTSPSSTSPSSTSPSSTSPSSTTPSSASNSTQPAAIVTTSEKSSSSAGIERLPSGIKGWYAQPAEKRKPIPRAKPDDPATTQFSWLTGLLPFIGRMDLYEKFDFKEELTKGKNLQLAATQVPEFINPLDDHQRWKGYPFNGMALTHFVGISGVEDARNVVAAKLPRTDPRAGVFGYDEVARPDDIKDGQSQTAMIAGAGALPNPWVFGGGATIRGAREPLFGGTSGLGTKGVPGGGSVVVMADGSVRHVSGNVDPKIFRAMCTINGNDSVDLDSACQPYSMDKLKTP